MGNESAHKNSKRGSCDGLGGVGVGLVERPGAQKGAGPGERGRCEGERPGGPPAGRWRVCRVRRPSNPERAPGALPVRHAGPSLCLHHARRVSQCYGWLLITQTSGIDVGLRFMGEEQSGRAHVPSAPKDRRDGRPERGTLIIERVREGERRPHEAHALHGEVCNKRQAEGSFPPHQPICEGELCTLIMRDCCTEQGGSFLANESILVRAKKASFPSSCHSSSFCSS